MRCLFWMFAHAVTCIFVTSIGNSDLRDKGILCTSIPLRDNSTAELSPLNQRLTPCCILQFVRTPSPPYCAALSGSRSSVLSLGLSAPLLSLVGKAWLASAAPVSSIGVSPYEPGPEEEARVTQQARAAASGGWIPAGGFEPGRRWTDPNRRISDSRWRTALSGGGLPWAANSRFRWSRRTNRGIAPRQPGRSCYSDGCVAPPGIMPDTVLLMSSSIRRLGARPVP